MGENGLKNLKWPWDVGVIEKNVKVEVEMCGN